jgi:outer membrane receptor protein involved in Fe transport
VEAAVRAAAQGLDAREDLSLHFGFYADSWQGDRFPGAGQHIPQFGDLQDRDWTDSDATLYMGKGALLWKLPADAELELNGFYWDNQHLTTFDLTRGAGILLEQRTDEHRGGVNLLVRQPDNFLNTQWVAGYGYDRMQMDAGAYKGKDRDIHSFFFQGKTSFPGDFVHLLYAARVDDCSDFGTQVTPRAGLIVQPTQESAIKLLYGRAFRAAVAPELYGTSAAEGNPNIDPETIDTVELLLLLERHNWRGELGGFWSRWSDGIAIRTGAGGPTYDNFAKSESWGAEASFRYVFKGWRADLSGSYVMSKNQTESRDYVAFPKYIFNLGLGYDWQKLDLHFYLITRIHLAAKEYPIIDSLPDPGDLENYYRTDLNINKGIGEGFEIWLTARNLFDRKNHLPGIWNAEGGIPDEPFNVSLGVRWRFE